MLAFKLTRVIWILFQDNAISLTLMTKSLQLFQIMIFKTDPHILIDDIVVAHIPQLAYGFFVFFKTNVSELEFSRDQHRMR